MWIDRANCRLCIIFSRINDLIKTSDPDKMKDLLIYLARVIEFESRSAAFAESFKTVAELSGEGDPYASYKAHLNNLGKKVAELVRRKLSELNWDLRTALRIAAASNIVDTTVLGYRPRKLEEAVWDPPAIEERVELPDKVYYILDNAGEAQIDLVVGEALLKNGVDVEYVVRSEAYEIDVLRKDLEDVKSIETPGNISPFKWLDKGFAISKGIANFEAYLEWGRIPALLLLRAKCDVIARMFSVNKNAPLIITGETAKAFLRQY